MIPRPDDAAFALELIYSRGLESTLDFYVAIFQRDTDTRASQQRISSILSQAIDLHNEIESGKRPRPRQTMRPQDLPTINDVERWFNDIDAACEVVEFDGKRGSNGQSND